MKSKEYKRFLKAEKKYKKALIKYIKKEEHSYDSYQFPAIIMMMLKRRLEYYTQGDNVWQSEDSQKLVIKSLEKAISLGEYALDDYNFYYEDDKEYFKKKTYESLDFKDYPHHTIEEKYEMLEKERTAYKQWFVYIAEHLNEWWD